jgi:ankyrin repeat protein
MQGRHSDDKELLKFIIKDNKDLINEKNTNSQLPLHIALKKQHFSAAIILNENGAGFEDEMFEINDYNGNNLVHTLVYYKQESLLSVLLKDERSKKLINIKNKNGETPFGIALNQREYKTIKILQENGVDGDETIKSFKTKDGKNVFHHLLSRYYVEDKFFSFLVKNYSNLINEQDDAGLTPLLVAIKEGGNIKFVSQLIENGADIALTAKGGNNILHYLFQNNSYNSGKYQKILFNQILEHKSATQLINAQNSNGQKPLIIAISRKLYDFAKELIAKEVDLEDTDKYGNNILHIFLKTGENKPEFLKFIWVKLTYEQQQKLINAKNNEGKTPLYISVTNQQHECTKFLVENKASFEIIANDGDNILHTLFSNYNLKEGLLNLILDHNFSTKDINAENNKGETPVSLALRRGHEKAVPLLIDKGANLEFITAEGDNVLHIIRDSSLLKLVLEKLPGNTIKDFINAKNKQGETPLLRAIKEREFDCVKELLSQGAEIDKDILNYEYSWSSNILHLVVDNNDKTEEILELFLEKLSTEFSDIEAEKIINGINDKGETALYIALKCEDIKAVSKLISYGAQVDEKILNYKYGWDGNNYGWDGNNYGWDGNNLIHFILAKSKEDPSELIKNLNISELINVKNANGETPLFKSISCGYYECTKQLIEQGANLTLTSKNGNTILHELAGRVGYQNSDKLCEMLCSIISTSTTEFVNAKNEQGATFWEKISNYDKEKIDLLDKLFEQIDLINNDNQSFKEFIIQYYLPKRAAKLGARKIVKIIELLDRNNLIDYKDSNELMNYFECLGESLEDSKKFLDLLIKKEVAEEVFISLFARMFNKDLASCEKLLEHYLDTNKEFKPQVVGEKILEAITQDTQQENMGGFYYNQERNLKNTPIKTIFKIIEITGVEDLDQHFNNVETLKILNLEEPISGSGDLVKILEIVDSFFGIVGKNDKLLYHFQQKILDKYTNLEEVKILEDLQDLLKLYQSINSTSKGFLNLQQASIIEYIQKNELVFTKFSSIGFRIPSKTGYNSGEYIKIVESSCQRALEKIKTISLEKDPLALYKDIISTTIINKQNNDGTTFLMKALQAHNIKLFNLLLENGADIGLTDNYGNNIFHWIAIDDSDSLFLEIALKYAKEEHLKAKNNDNYTPLGKAIDRSNLEIACKFIESTEQLPENMRSNFLQEVRYKLNRESDCKNEIIKAYVDLGYKEELKSDSLIEIFGDLLNSNKVKNGFKVCKYYFNKLLEEIKPIVKYIPSLKNSIISSTDKISKNILEKLTTKSLSQENLNSIKEALYIVEGNGLKHEENDNIHIKSILDCYDILNFKLVDPKINPELLLAVLDTQLKNLTKEELTSLNNSIYERYCQNKTIDQLDKLVNNPNINETIKKEMVFLIIQNKANTQSLELFKKLGLALPNTDNKFLEELGENLKETKEKLTIIEELYHEVSKDCHLGLYKHMLRLTLKESFTTQLCQEVEQIFEKDKEDDLKTHLENLVSSLSPREVGININGLFEEEKYKVNNVNLNKSIKMLMDEIISIHEPVGNLELIQTLIKKIKESVEKYPIGLAIDILNMPIMTAELELGGEQNIIEENIN